MINNYFKLTLLIISIFTLSFDSAAQTQDFLDGAYVKETHPWKRVIPYPYLREADVMYSKRLWQVIDLKQKMNHPYFYPVEKINNRLNLFNVIKKGLLIDASLNAYSPGSAGEEDEWMSNNRLSRDEVFDVLNPTTFIEKYDDDTGEQLDSEESTEEISSELITRYVVKEDWIWDKQRSERYVRIIGIAPQMEIIDENDNVIGYQTLFWLYYDECRHVFAHAEAFNLFNDAQRRTYEDLFQKRYFTSYVVKESNVYDRTVMSYARNMDVLYESERIKEELFILEHDLWHY